MRLEEAQALSVLCSSCKPLSGNSAHDQASAAASGPGADTAARSRFFHCFGFDGRYIKARIERRPDVQGDRIDKHYQPGPGKNTEAHDKGVD